MPHIVTRRHPRGAAMTAAAPIPGTRHNPDQMPVVSRVCNAAAEIDLNSYMVLVRVCVRVKGIFEVRTPANLAIGTFSKMVCRAAQVVTASPSSSELATAYKNAEESDEQVQACTASSESR